MWLHYTKYSQICQAGSQATFIRAVVGDRTRDLILTMDVLYQLSYNGVIFIFIITIFILNLLDSILLKRSWSNCLPAELTGATEPNGLGCEPRGGSYNGTQSGFILPVFNILVNLSPCHF